MKRTVIAAVILLIANAAFAAEVVKRGEPVSSAKAVPLTTVLASPKAYTKDAVVVEGVIEKSCTAKGCWMELAPAPGEKTVHVTFKDEKFVIPLSARGMQARAGGVVSVTRHADGTADEISFVASGIELKHP